MATLRYGSNSKLHLEPDDGVGLGEVGTPRGEPLDDARAAASAALHEPLDYPPLAQSTTPGDHVVVALDSSVPQAAEITAAVVQAVADAGVASDGITVLQTEGNFGDPCRMVPASLRQRIKLLTHASTDRRQLAYLAASESGEAILVNRALHEADVVLPIGCLRADDTAGYFGIHSVVFPSFADAKTSERFRIAGLRNGHGRRTRELAAEVDHVAWVLGVNFTLQVVPAAGGGVLQVLAGESESVRRRGRELYRAAWNWPVTERASLVVAAIEGDAEQQTWENVGRALQAAGRFVDDDGAIALCCELATDPGPALQRMAYSESREAALRQVHKERPADALPAVQLAETLEQHSVYLLSRLDPAVIEDLGVIPVAGHDELGRLARQHRSCILLSNAQYVTSIA
jgi:nickel-dependent lactate racemase